MTVRGTALLAPALPQVNLLPGEVREARTVGLVKRWFTLCAGVTVLAVGTVTGVAHLLEQDADSQLAQAEAETAGLVAETGPLADVTRVQARIDTLTAARGHAMASEVLWSEHLGAITAVTPAGVGIRTLDYAGATPLQGAEPSTDPLVSTALGTLSFTAVAAELTDTASWADALDAIPGFRDVRVTSTAMAGRGRAFTFEISGSIQVDQTALAHRFDTQPGGTP